MKHASFIFRSVLAGTVLFAACKKSNLADGPVNVGGYLSSGTWRVAQFASGGQDVTPQFNNYSLTFASTGTLTVSDSTNTATGNWGAGIVDGVSKVSMLFPATSTFQQLSKDWNVQNASENSVELSDTSSGGQNLLLERN
ncbi:MAG: hypothetical protein EOO15_18105 [Chitinophagaceae bacterium]|nr:MAG: hypothetical protein EOO15_18105 [Chitinophagaceae bacterium]